ncbi:CarD family transcriptional regulator [Spirochaeta isovalerica]|uniref:CarD family transcriptional regulator n=1 Tax=Spirochaeta isovalerica TaxID=150 RepID=A0A841RJY9_9SPIO|nr:CarD family transcriptional regulator [Spirochaeta isovalerica]MBB6482602.1 CarD family transcriptional regulator [Spirochaeta isovalerica]
MEKKSANDTLFSEGQTIVYPLQGVGKITEIFKKEFKGNEILYYNIYLEVSDMTVMVPVDKAEELGIRAIVSTKDSEKALELISQPNEPVTGDWKMRYQMNLDLLKSGSVLDIAVVVRSLYHRSKVKELPILERKIFDTALKLLIDEIASSLSKSTEDTEEMIFSRLEAETEE